MMKKRDYRPKIHFSPEKGWMNDPNGMVYVDGEYHFFYQKYPYDTSWGPVSYTHLAVYKRQVMDGIICCADIPSSVSLAEIHRPIVMIDRYVTEGIPCIHSDHKRGGELAAQALLSAGCKNVLYFASSATERGYSMAVSYTHLA